MQTRSIALRGVASVMALTAVVCLTEVASAQFSISGFTVDGGGGRTTGGTYAVSGTIAQPDAGRLSGGSYSVSGGFWGGGGGGVSGIPDADPGDGVDTPSTTPPIVFRIYPVSPNPVSEQMMVAFDLPETRLVRASIYDASGRLVRTLADGTTPAGHHQRSWDRRDEVGNPVAAGIYFVRFDAGAHRSHQKVVVVQ